MLVNALRCNMYKERMIYQVEAEGEEVAKAMSKDMEENVQRRTEDDRNSEVDGRFYRPPSFSRLHERYLWPLPTP